VKNQVDSSKSIEEVNKDITTALDQLERRKSVSLDRASLP